MGTVVEAVLPKINYFKHLIPTHKHYFSIQTLPYNCCNKRNGASQMCFEVCIMACMASHMPKLYEENVPLKRIICKFHIHTVVVLLMHCRGKTQGSYIKV